MKIDRQEGIEKKLERETKTFCHNKIFLGRNSKERTRNMRTLRTIQKQFNKIKSTKLVNKIYIKSQIELIKIYVEI